MANQTLSEQSLKDQLIQRFASIGLAQGASANDARRKTAESALASLEIPTPKWEEWKYTRLKALLNKEYLPAPTPDTLPSLPGVDALEADVLVFLNGIFQPTASKWEYNAETVNMVPLAEISDAQWQEMGQAFGEVVAAEEDIFTAINTAYAHQGVIIHVPKGAAAKAPIHLLHYVDTPHPTGMLHRNLILLEEGASAEIVESFQGNTGDTETLRNLVSEVKVGDQAHLSYVKLQQEGDACSMVDHCQVHVGRDSRFSIYTLTFGGRIVRNNLKINLLGKNGEAHLMGLYLLDGIQHVDNHTQVDHAVPHCFSNELYKGILSEKSTGVFNGRIHVYPDAQKTNAFQSNRNILLSDTANIFTKPQLEIYADDVKCSHGATTGRLDEEAMFYLRSRGIEEAVAKKLMIHAFAAEVIEEMGPEVLKSHVLQLIEERF